MLQPSLFMQYQMLFFKKKIKQNKNPIPKQPIKHKKGKCDWWLTVPRGCSESHSQGQGSGVSM